MQRSIKAGAVLLGGFVLVLAAYANCFHDEVFISMTITSLWGS